MVFMGDKSTEDQQHRNCLKDTHAVNSQVLEEHSVCSNYLTFSSVFYASKTWKFETTTAPLSPFFLFFKKGIQRKMEDYGTWWRKSHHL